MQATNLSTRGKHSPFFVPTRINICIRFQVTLASIWCNTHAYTPFLYRLLIYKYTIVPLLMSLTSSNPKVPWLHVCISSLSTVWLEVRVLCPTVSLHCPRPYSQMSLPWGTSNRSWGGRVEPQRNHQTWTHPRFVSWRNLPMTSNYAESNLVCPSHYVVFNSWW